MDPVATILGGLGLFFIGVKLIGDNLKRMTGKRFRALARKTTNSPILAAGLGTLSGALTQSTSAVTFIATGLVTAGLVEPRKAMPLVIWSNLGTAALVMAATLNIHAFILSLLAATGLCYFMDLHKATQWRALLGAMLGLGLLFLGLDLMKSGTEPLRTIAIVRDFVTFSSTSLFIAFLIGALLTLVAQSSATVSVIAVTLVSTGILGMDQTVMIIYGAGVGSGLSVWFLASNLSGTPKRLVNLQMVTKMAGAVVLIPLFLVEKTWGTPLVLEWVAGLTAEPARQAAWIYLIYQIAATVTVTLLSRPLAALIERLQPPGEEETLSRPQYLEESALDSPETAIDLVDREQARMVSHMVAALNNLRPDMAHLEDLPHHGLLLTATQALGEEIQGFLAELTDQEQSRHILEAAVVAQNRVSLLLDLRDTIGEMIKAVEEEDQIAPEVAPLAHALMESLHLTLEMLAEETVSGDPMSLDTLVALTGDRSDMMERTRRSLIQSSRQLDQSAQELLFATTAQFERAQWLIHRCARLTRRRNDI
ncbi:Na/Pi cotransporter family protein [Rhodospirillum sp. A1_3_36]|uniref:Na/Pi cotransporter family protein n=1 Tax=Rhodospirillum sp. A1_3_36 TaxID=3391666 RepID=UPI0039A4AE65